MKHPVTNVEVFAYEVPTDFPESDGTLEWNSTTLVVVTARAGSIEGLGYTFADKASASLTQSKLAPLVLGKDALAVTHVWQEMIHAVRNLGSTGLAAMAISAVDVALWDLKARLLNIPLVQLLGQVRPDVPAYGSGGFTSYSATQLAQQLRGWVESGLSRVKMKVGRYPERDQERVWSARQAIGPTAELYIDANGAYSRKQALALAHEFRQCGVSWFEEPVSSDDLEGLREIRQGAPPEMEIAAGEYGFDLFYFRRMLDAHAVDVLQADATRCGGITGFCRAAELCRARSMPLSAHTAPSLHTHVCCALEPVRHVEYFHDHARIEQMLFDGALLPISGSLAPDLSRPGLGMSLRREVADRYLVFPVVGALSTSTLGQETVEK